MIRDVLVHIPTDRQVRPVVDGAVSLATAFAAHLDAVATAYIPDSASFIIEGGAAAGSILRMERERATQRAEAALAVFDAEARNAGIGYSCRVVSTLPAELGELARLHDLAVVLQPDPDQGGFDNSVPLEILFGSGGPVLFIPYIFSGTFRAERIGICWDGSRVAARAVRDAAPFLERAGAVRIITVNEAGNESPASAGSLGRHLARRGCAADVVTLSAARSEIQPLIQSWAADEAIDMLVMGGYGHSRLQEALLGGVSRAMLQSMTVPTLISH